MPPRLTGIAALLALLAPASYADVPSYEFAREAGHVLEVKEGPALLKQCSRPAPENATGFWKPTPADITKMEATTLTYLDQPSIPPDMSASPYQRQYIGFTAGGKKFIYGNYYPAPDEPKDPSKPAIVCDGGPRFFGIVYDITNDKVLKFDRNGAL